MSGKEETDQEQIERKIVTPGDEVADAGFKVVTPNTIYVKGDKYYSLVVGLAKKDLKNKTISIIPLEGYYYPKKDDVVVGIVTSVGLTSWEVDIRAPFPGILYASDFLGKPVNPAKEDLTNYLDVGDVVIAKIDTFDRTRDPHLTTRGRGLGKVKKGTVIEVSPVKVPRLIGRKGSMQSVLEGETGCRLVIGMNGRIVINCPNQDAEEMLVLAIRKIEREAHTTGLTDRVKEFILKEKVRRGIISGR